jgi:DNA-binding XRE family transcriptional regulator
MGKVIRFHARASTGSPTAAKASKVISAHPFSPASRTSSGQRPGGMPRLRQPLTMDGFKPSASETAPVPPRASIVESGVNMEVNIVRTLRTSQEFATCETTFPVDCGPLGPMIDPPETIGPRLKALRLALKCKTQTDFARKLGIEKNTYNPFEKGSRELTFETACLIRKRFKIPVDYLFWGDMEDQLPAAVSSRLSRAA